MVIGMYSSRFDVAKIKLVLRKITCSSHQTNPVNLSNVCTYIQDVQKSGILKLGMTCI